jgi:hypothetical protein
MGNLWYNKRGNIYIIYIFSEKFVAFWEKQLLFFGKISKKPYNFAENPLNFAKKLVYIIGIM